MTHYLDIHLRHDPEFPPHQLLSALCGKLHRALVYLGADSLGLSFPGYDLRALRLGDTVRIVGSPDALAGLMAVDWLTGMRDHVVVNQVSEVPAGSQHRSLRRVQAKSNPERLRRRHMKRHGIDEATARARVPDSAAEVLRLPFVQLTSASTGQAFRLYLRLGDVEPAPVAGRFNTYGLSTIATIPCF